MSKQNGPTQAYEAVIPLFLPATTKHFTAAKTPQSRSPCSGLWPEASCPPHQRPFRSLTFPHSGLGVEPKNYSTYSLSCPNSICQPPV